jgi:site-specific recombinase XerD
MPEKETITLKNAIDAYLAHLAESGTKKNTINVYERALGLALSHFGEGKKLTAIMVPHTAGYYKSDLLTKHPTGKSKAAPTIKQNKRVFRQCLQFAKDCGWLAILPVPKAELQHARSKKHVSSQSKSTVEEPDIPAAGRPESSDQEAKIDS